MQRSALFKAFALAHFLLGIGVFLAYQSGRLPWQGTGRQVSLQTSPNGGALSPHPDSLSQRDSSSQRFGIPPEAFRIMSSSKSGRIFTLPADIRLDSTGFHPAPAADTLQHP